MKREFQNNGRTVTYYRIAFTLSNESQWYAKQPSIKNFKKVPTDLKIEETHDSKIKQRSEYLLRGRTVNGKCTLHLGLENQRLKKCIVQRWTTVKRVRYILFCRTIIKK